ncbi:MAG: hypothetical protein IPO22_07020 [Anaerolineales bacterium]|nr:hypothetical protein [Anaerolineales bacterium]
MKIALVLSQGIHYFYYDRVVRGLHAAGHEVCIVCPASFSEDGNKSGRALVKLLQDEVDVQFEDALPRKKDIYFAELIRGLRDYANFVRPEHPTPHIAVGWVRKELSPKMMRLVQKPFIRSVLAGQMARRLLVFLESLIPPEEQIVAWLKKFQPQVVFVSPYVFTSYIETEYTKAARSLNIPVIASLLSWDNLTSKGTYKVKPDRLFVWNQSLVEEAVQIHDFEAQQVFVTGAPVYDPWFELTPAQDRASFCSQSGIDPSKPYVLYLCSSKGIAEREIELIHMLVDQFEKVEEDARPSILIRPHPFKEMDEAVIENEWVRVFPKGGQRPDTDEARSAYYDSLYYSAAVIGVNTTGFLESAILDKPCLTVVTPQTSRGQEMRAHFKHLMDAGYIQVAKDFPELVEMTMENISGSDAGRENRARFVRSFIRPHGLKVQASQVMTGAILAVAEGCAPEEWMRFHG